MRVFGYLSLLLHRHEAFGAGSAIDLGYFLGYPRVAFELGCCVCTVNDAAVCSIMNVLSNLSYPSTVIDSHVLCRQAPGGEEQMDPGARVNAEGILRPRRSGKYRPILVDLMSLS